MARREAVRLAPSQVDNLIRSLASRGYDVLGPRAKDGAIVYDRVHGVSDLPRGVTDEQEPGRYRLKERSDEALFGYAVGPTSWKKFLHPAHLRLFAAEQQDGVFRILNNVDDPGKPLALVGVRACELAAVGIQDRVLLGSQYADPVYRERRESAFVVAVQCTHTVSTCFCRSMGTGPQVAATHADITLTEVVNAHDHWLLAEAGTSRGRAVLRELQAVPATDEDRQIGEAAVTAAAHRQTRSVDSSGLRELLTQAFEHPRWEHAGDRCLACANCTMVCPTCFCTTVEDTSDLSGARAERWRRWDSCLTASFSYIHGGSVRVSVKARHRQRITHKLAYWLDQFGSSGCVGCGRCITWCPVGIDMTEEVQAIRGMAGYASSDT